jgi:opacity protein-like surface antigen
MGLRLDIARRYWEWPFCSGLRDSPRIGKHTLDFDAGARFGVVLNNGVLLYGKAGGAWVDNHATITNLKTGASISASNRNSGWVVGGGVEWALGGNWSAKLEYDFVKLDDLTFGPGPFRGDTFTASREIDV